MRILEELWYGNIEPTEYGSSLSPEYRNCAGLLTATKQTSAPP